MGLGTRIVIPDVPHHITQRGNNRQNVFLEEGDFRRYLSYLVLEMQKTRVLLHGYCLMNNHFHLIVTPPTKQALSNFMKISNQRYAQFWNLHKGRSGHVWRNRFFSCPLDEAHLWRALRYVELNPVRAKIVTNPWEYQWSSALFHATENPPKPVIPLEKIDGCWKAAEWRNFLEQADDPQDLTEIRFRTAQCLPWGGKDLPGLDSKRGLA